MPCVKSILKSVNKPINTPASPPSNNVEKKRDTHFLVFTLFPPYPLILMTILPCLSKNASEDKE